MSISSDETAPERSSRRRRALLVAVVVSLAAAAVDLRRPPERQLSARALIEGVHVYQKIGSRFFPRGQCRFAPTCSGYAETVIARHGVVHGGRLTAIRLLRCGPWTPRDTDDPPP